MFKKVIPSILLLMATAAGAQTVNNAGTYAWPAATTTGVVGTSLAFGTVPPTNYTIHAVVTGTAPTTCTWEADSSPDNAHWDPTTALSITGSQNCTAVVTTVPVTYHVTPYLQIKINALTGGDATTKVTFYLTRGVGQ